MIDPCRVEDPAEQCCLWSFIWNCLTTCKLTSGGRTALRIHCAARFLWHTFTLFEWSTREPAHPCGRIFWQPHSGVVMASDPHGSMSISGRNSGLLRVGTRRCSAADSSSWQPHPKCMGTCVRYELPYDRHGSMPTSGKNRIGLYVSLMLRVITVHYLAKLAALDHRSRVDER